MLTVKSASNCRWAVQTMWLDAPLWLDAWMYPWSCVRDSDARPLESTDECRSCPRWQPHGATATPAQPPHGGAR